MSDRYDPSRRLPDGRIDLPELTLAAVSSVAIDQTIRAMGESMRGLRFARAVLLTDAAVPKPEGIDVCLIDPIRSVEAYSRFMLERLVDHITTPFVLCVQWDGYVLDPESWRDTFLDYDYIGAPWPHVGPELVVGNGGFSMRSRRLLQAAAQLGLDFGIGEDLAICRDGRLQLERDHAIRFAPPGTALRFAYERTCPTADTFGFHGVFNMPALDQFSGGRFTQFYRDLPAGLIRRIENCDLLERALKLRNWHLAAAIIRTEVHERGVFGGLRGFLQYWLMRNRKYSSSIRSVLNHTAARRAASTF